MNVYRLEDFILHEIELPALARVQELVQKELITASDADRFRTAANMYKHALFSQCDQYDPRVRIELERALLKDYRNEIERLLKEVAQRDIWQPAPAARHEHMPINASVQELVRNQQCRSWPVGQTLSHSTPSGIANAQQVDLASTSLTQVNAVVHTQHMSSEYGTGIPQSGDGWLTAVRLRLNNCFRHIRRPRR